MHSSWFVIALFACATVGAASLVSAADKPNILVIYIDDMGWAEPGCCGGTRAPTPNIDAIAAAGARCTNGYVSACVCSPSRAGLLTGRYQARSGHDANPRKEKTGLALTETLMSQRFKDLAYATAIVGKWHLGSFEPDYLPIHRGFDVSAGSISNLGEGVPPYFYRGEQTLDEFPGAPVTTPVYVDEACKFIDTHKDSPWFLYLPLNAVHGPIVASPSYLARYADLEPREQAYAAMIRETDDGIGRVLHKLRELNLEENTLIFVISDNGGASELADMGGLRGRKWLLWEGGIRVTWLVQWKGRIPAGQVVNEPVIQLDVLPTAIAAAGAEVERDWQLDGVNLLPLLERKIKKLSPRELYFRFGVQYAVRQGDWKLVKADIDMKPMLVNLADDLGEQNDLSNTEPARVQALQALYDKWNASMLPPRWEDKRWNGEAAHRATVEKKSERKKNERKRRNPNAK